MGARAETAGGEDGDVEDEEEEEEFVRVDGEFSSFMEGLKTSIEAAAARRRRERAPGDGEEGQSRLEWNGQEVSRAIGQEEKKGEMSEELLGEVHTALNKLQGTLQSAGNLDPEKSRALLSLISTLQTSLAQQRLTQKGSPEVKVATQAAPQPRSAVPDWKARNQKKRQGRAHTVGVSKEELADARRLLEKCQQEEKYGEEGGEEKEEEGKKDREGPTGSPSVHLESKGYSLMKQSSAGELGPPAWATNSLAARVFRPVHFEPQRSPTWASMFNKTAKPFQREALGKNPPTNTPPPPSNVPKYPLKPPPLPPPPAQPQLSSVTASGVRTADVSSGGSESSTPKTPTVKNEVSPAANPPKLPLTAQFSKEEGVSNVPQINSTPPAFQPTYHPPPPSQTYWPSSPYSPNISSSQTSSVMNGHSHRDSESSVTGSTSTKPETEEDEDEDDEECFVAETKVGPLKVPNSQMTTELGDEDDIDEDDDDDDEENESEVVTQKETYINGVASNDAKTIEPPTASSCYSPEKRSVHHSLSLDSGTAKEGLKVKEGGGGEAATRASPLARSWTLDDPSALLFTPAECVQIAVHKAAIKKQLSYEGEQRMRLRNKPISGTENAATSEGPALAKEGENSDLNTVGFGSVEYSPVIAKGASGSRSSSYISDSRTNSDEVSRTTSGSSVSSSASSRNSAGAINGISESNEVKGIPNPPTVPLRKDSIKTLPSYSSPSQPALKENHNSQTKTEPEVNKRSSWSQNQEQNIPNYHNYVQTTVQNFQPNVNEKITPLNDGIRHIQSNGPSKNVKEADERPLPDQSHAARIQSKLDKKKKMKRANTIDIPKPLNFYVNEDDYLSGDEIEEDDDEMAALQGTGDGSTSLGTHRAAYLALRGPIRVKLPGNQGPAAPSFEAKTESDRKFLAFLEQHSGTTSNKTEPAYHSSARGGAHWSNRFSNIKTTFEGPGRGSEFPGETRGRGGGRGFAGGRVSGPASARNFWRAADDSVTRSRSNSHEPRLSREGSTLLRRLFEERDAAAHNQFSVEKENAKRRSSEQISKLPWAGDSHFKGEVAAKDSVVIGSLTVANKKQLFSALNASPPSPEVKGPVPVGKFSHAPLSAFRPLPSKEQSSSSSSSSTPLSSPGAVRLATQKFSTTSTTPPSPSINHQSNLAGPRLGTKSPVSQKKTFVPMQESQSPKGGPPPWAKEDTQGRVMSSTARFETFSRDNSPPPQVSYSSHSHVVHSHNMLPGASQPLSLAQFSKNVPYSQSITQPVSDPHGFVNQSNAPTPPPRSNAPRTYAKQQQVKEKPKLPPRPYSPQPPNIPPPPSIHTQPPLPPAPMVPPVPPTLIEPPSPEPQLQCAAVAKVMAAPVFQQAVVQKRRKGGMEADMEEEEEIGRESAAKNLSSALHRLSVSPCRPARTTPPSPPNPIDIYQMEMPADSGRVYSADTYLHPLHASYKGDEQKVISHVETQPMQYVGYSQSGAVTHQPVQDPVLEESHTRKILPKDQEEFYRKQLLAVQEAQRAQKRLEEAQNEYLSSSNLHQNSLSHGYQSPKTHKVQHASLTSDTRELNDESVVTMRLQIPVKEPEWNAPHRETMSLSPFQKGIGAVRSSSYHDVRRAVSSVPLPEERRPSPKREIDDRSPTSVLQKSESWHLLGQLGRSSPNSKRPQSLSLDQNKRRVPTALPKMSFPKQFEARLSPETVETKQKTVEAYLKGQGTGTPPPARRKMKIQESPRPLLLDDNLENVDEAFESLFNAATMAQDKRVSGEKSEVTSKSYKACQKVQYQAQNQQHLLRPPAPPRESSTSPQFQRKKKAWEESTMVKTKLAQNLPGSHSEATTMSSSTDSSVTKTEVHTKSSNYSATVTGKSRVSKDVVDLVSSYF